MLERNVPLSCASCQAGLNAWLKEKPWHAELRLLAWRYSPSGIYRDLASMTEREQFECLVSLRRRAEARE